MPEEPVWLPVSEAARRLGVTPQAIRNRIARGTLEARTKVAGNRTTRLVRLPDTVPATVPGTASTPVAHRDDTLVAELRARIAALERHLDEGHAERDRLLAIVERLTAERASPERRPWPGLRRWWRRLWEGEGREE